MRFLDSFLPPTVRKMHGRGDEEGLERLASDPRQEKSVRCEALQALGAMRARGAEAAAETALDDPAWECRLAAAAVLVDLDNPKGTEHLVRILDGAGEPSEARVAAALILSESGRKRGRSFLAKLDRSELVRAERLLELIAPRVIVERDLKWLAESSSGELRKTIVNALRSRLRAACLGPDLRRRVEAALQNERTRG